MTHQPAISFSISFHFPFNRAGGRTSNVRRINKMKTLPYLLPIICTSFWLSSCKSDQKTSFALAKAEILKELSAREGEVVEVVGDEGPFRYCGYRSTAVGDSGGAIGTSVGRHVLKYSFAPDHYYEIHKYENRSGGGLLVSRRISVPTKVADEK